MVWYFSISGGALTHRINNLFKSSKKGLNRLGIVYISVYILYISVDIVNIDNIDRNINNVDRNVDSLYKIDNKIRRVTLLYSSLHIATKFPTPWPPCDCLHHFGPLSWDVPATG